MIEIMKAMYYYNHFNRSLKPNFRKLSMPIKNNTYFFSTQVKSHVIFFKGKEELK